MISPNEKCTENIVEMLEKSCSIFVNGKELSFLLSFINDVLPPRHVKLILSWQNSPSSWLRRELRDWEDLYACESQIGLIISRHQNTSKLMVTLWLRIVFNALWSNRYQKIIAFRYVMQGRSVQIYSYHVKRSMKMPSHEELDLWLSKCICPEN